VIARPRLLRAAPPGRETLPLQLRDGSCVELLRVRDARARRLRLTVTERGARLTLPLRTSDATGERFVREHLDWLTAQWARRIATPALLPHVTAELPLRGALHAVQWTLGARVRVELQDGHIAIRAPEGEATPALRRALRDFYEAQARADVGRWLPRYLAGLPRAPTRVRFRSMTSLWGSLSADGAMSLDLSLVLATPAAFEYVLVHELCHLLHMDHSRAFWREVDARCPGWRLQRSYFKAEGARVKATLRGLCG